MSSTPSPSIDTPTASSTSAPTSSHGSNSAATAIGVVFAILAVFLFVGAAWWYIRRRRNFQTAAQDQDLEAHSGNGTIRSRSRARPGTLIDPSHLAYRVSPFASPGDAPRFGESTELYCPIITKNILRNVLTLRYSTQDIHQARICASRIDVQTVAGSSPRCRHLRSRRPSHRIQSTPHPSAPRSHRARRSCLRTSSSQEHSQREDTSNTIWKECRHHRIRRKTRVSRRSSE